MSSTLLPDLGTKILIPVCAVVCIVFPLIQWYLVSQVKLSPDSGRNNNNKNRYSENLIEEEEEGLNEHSVVTKCDEIQFAISEGSMNSAWSSKFSNPNPKSRGASCGGSLTCYHGLPAQLRIAKRGTRPGNKFYGCANWPDNNCKFFKWEDDIDKSTNEIDKHEQLEVEIGALVDKIQN